MSRYSDLELRYARPVARAILDDTGFRDWVLKDTQHVGATPIGAIQGSLRSQSMKNAYWFNYWCGKDSRCACRIGSGIETDILLVMNTHDARRVALHIEVKRPGERLGDGQAESYPRRAACWANAATRPRTVSPHDQFLTMLVCGRELAADERVRWFDKLIFHDQIAERIQPYPEGNQLAAV
jgi:hypothetical protein